MSGIGHLAAGFAAKPAAPQASLWILLAASETNEILYFIFTAVGIEPKADYTMSFSQGIRHLTPAAYPWSHGLLMSLVYTALAVVLALLFYRQRRTAGVIGLAVFSHWGLDFLMHSNLPLFFGSSPMVGLGLENSGPGFIFMTALDLVLLAGGLAAYLVSRKRTHVKLEHNVRNLTTKDTQI
jgi:membrane-bound metal-dependent hydrolase YbcI (DUF457 family)